jgi:hypothetical protein
MEFAVHVDQVPALMALGKIQFHDGDVESHLRRYLSASVTRRALAAMKAASAAPMTHQLAFDAFYGHYELGLAYLALFEHRHHYYHKYTGNLWRSTRGDKSIQMVDYIAHTDPAVCCSNNSGMVGPAISYAVSQSLPMVDLGCGEASYLKSAPASLCAVGFELNCNPLLIQTICKNVFSFCRRGGHFFFVPVSFCAAEMPPGDLVLFSWHPGSHQIPVLDKSSTTTAFFVGVSFDNMAPQGLRPAMQADSVILYTNRPERIDTHAAKTFSFVDPDVRPDYARLINGFDAKVHCDARRARGILGSAPPLSKPRERAAYLLRSVRWKTLRSYMLCNTTSASVTKLLTSGIPQGECKSRIRACIAANVE